MTDEKMPLTSHLDELRKRIIVLLIAISIGFGVCFYYSESIFNLLTLPLRNTLVLSLKYPFIALKASENPALNLVFLTPTEALWTHIKIAIVSGVIMALPVIFYEIWRFISPGLLQKEKKYAIPFVILVTALFLLGAFFCFVFVLPFALNFLLTYKTEGLQPMISVGRYVDFCLKFILAFGVIFEIPVVIVFLTKTGIVSTKFLAKNRKYAVLLAFIIAAFLTPTPDAFNQTLMAAPIVLLYEVGILASKLLGGRKKND
ncbi:MAG TPA: twin-arginine translocase subunit TatC [Nitrospiraceae bacterium]|nr:twin-arginine translocase subunit TatC [Nitrospiraceae bacterium]